MWLPTVQRKLLHPGQGLVTRLAVSVPTALQVGAYEVLVGVKGQWLAVPGSQLTALHEITWAAPPLIAEIKRPSTHKRIFLSHSVKDLSQVSALAAALDNAGIEPIIAEAEPTPGAVLSHKFAALIDQSDVLVALLSHQSVRSRWVLSEIDYAVRRNKPRILLRDRALHSSSTPVDHIEWNEVDLRGNPQQLSAQLFAALQQLSNTRAVLRVKDPNADAVAAALIAGLFGLLVGASVSRGHSAAGEAP